MKFSDWVWQHLVWCLTSLVGSSQSLEDSEQQHLRPPGKRMTPSRALVLGIFALTTVLSPCGGEDDIKADHVGSYGLSFYQSQSNGQYTMEFDGDEKLYVDAEKKETVWRIPEFSHLINFDPQGGLQTIAVAKHNLDVLIKVSNSTPATNKEPEVTMFPKAPVMLGHPNTLICSVDNIFPPVVNITWLKNSKPVTEGVYETNFLFNRDYSFHKMSYLTFIPSDDDVYDCKVEHWGLEEPALQHWEPKVPAPMSELTETVVCALGLSVGIVGIVVGTIFIIQGLRSGGSSRRPGPL